MPVQQVQLEEVMISEFNDESLEHSISGQAANSYYGIPTCNPQLYC